LGGLGTALAFAAFGTRGLVYELADGGWQAFTVVVTASAIAFLGLIVGMKLVGAVPAAMLSNLEVVFTIVFATRILGEALTPMKLTGAAIIIGAVLVAQAHGWRKQRG
jgi:drug/metabolite transporter (DMT)-like permease